MIDPHPPGGLLGRVGRLGDDRRHRLAVILRLAHREERAIGMSRPEPPGRLRQVGGGDDQANARNVERIGDLHAENSGACHVQLNEANVERLREPEVGDVALRAADAFDPADAPGG